VDVLRFFSPTVGEKNGGLSPILQEEQLVELVMLAGLYHAVSFMVNATGVQHEAFAPRFPSHA
jgi:hypothetical protein